MGRSTVRCGFLGEKKPCNHGLEHNSLSIILFRVVLKQHSIQRRFCKEWSQSLTIGSPKMASYSFWKPLLWLSEASWPESVLQEDRGHWWGPDSSVALLLCMASFSLLLRFFLIECTGQWEKGRKVDELQPRMLQPFPSSPLALCQIISVFVSALKQWRTTLMGKKKTENLGNYCNHQSK